MVVVQLFLIIGIQINKYLRLSPWSAMISRLTSVFSDSVAFIAGAASSAHIPELTSLPEVRLCPSVSSMVSSQIGHCNRWGGLGVTHTHPQLAFRSCKCRQIVPLQCCSRSKLSPSHQQKSGALIAKRYPHPLLTASSKGHTQQFNFYRVGAEPGKLILVDTPGYGKRGRPEWGDMLDEYLKTRKQ